MRILSTLFVFVLSLGAYASNTRPTNSVFFKNDFCGCRDFQSITSSQPNCSNFCRNKNTGGEERLYYNFNVGPEISQGALQNVVNWCTQDVGTQDRNVSCQLHGKYLSDEGSPEEIQIEIAGSVGQGGNSFFSRLEDLDSDRIYILTLVATSEALLNQTLFNLERV